MMRSSRRALVALAFASNAACSSQTTARPEPRPDASTPRPPVTVPDAHAPMTRVDSGRPSVPPVVHTYAPTYAAIYDEVLKPSCAFEFCHGGSGLFMDLETKALGYSTLVNFKAAGVDCQSTGLFHVLPGKPEQSLLYLKITTPPCGKKMPLMYVTSGMLDPREIEQIRQWILRGAPDDGDGDAAATLAEAGAPGRAEAGTDAD
ncbi:MAG TPA: hypothetical protein VH062_15940 [Polyangiaceae bacterium]|nr:hypothetical protein [Polyangiaceae bacterium]